MPVVSPLPPQHHTFVHLSITLAFDNIILLVEDDVLDAKTLNSWQHLVYKLFCCYHKITARVFNKVLNLRWRMHLAQRNTDSTTHPCRPLRNHIRGVTGTEKCHPYTLYVIIMYIWSIHYFVTQLVGQPEEVTVGMQSILVHYSQAITMRLSPQEEGGCGSRLPGRSITIGQTSGVMSASWGQATLWSTSAAERDSELVILVKSSWGILQRCGVQLPQLPPSHLVVHLWEWSAERSRNAKLSEKKLQEAAWIQVRTRSVFSLHCWQTVQPTNWLYVRLCQQGL